MIKGNFLMDSNNDFDNNILKHTAATLTVEQGRVNTRNTNFNSACLRSRQFANHFEGYISCNIDLRPLSNCIGGGIVILLISSLVSTRTMSICILNSEIYF